MIQAQSALVRWFGPCFGNQGTVDATTGVKLYQIVLDRLLHHAETVVTDGT